jgi:hypothetical protein
MNRLQLPSLICLVVLLLGMIFCSCSLNDDDPFGIYLSDNGGLVIGFDDVAYYNSQEHTLELNKQGIARWNSFQNYTGPPKLSQSLYNRGFIIKVGGKEIARGTFWSNLSSMSLNGLAIMDSMFEMGPDHNKLQLISDYPGSSLGSEYRALDQQLADIFSTSST